MFNVEAKDWQDALVVAGQKLTHLCTTKHILFRVDSPASVIVQDPVAEKPTNWQRLRQGPNHEEASRLAMKWVDANRVIMDRTAQDELVGLIEGILDRSR